MPRGVLMGGAIVLLSGKRVQTCYGCDLEYLSLDGIREGTVVGFDYVSGSEDAENLRKVTPNSKELELQASLAPAKKSKATSKKPAAKPKKAVVAKATAKTKATKAKPVSPRTKRARDITNALTTAGVLAPVSDRTLATVVKDMDEALDEDDPAANLIMNLPSTELRSCVLFDHHVDVSTVTEFDRALTGERLRLRGKEKRNGEIDVTALVDGKAIETTRYDDNRTLTGWLESLLHDHAIARRLYYVPHEDYNVAILVTPAQAKALRKAAISVETSE